MVHTLADYSTLVVALATVAYVLVTALLWRATKQSADAAKSSADAAKLSAEVSQKAADRDAALHRPYLGVALFQRQSDFNADVWAVRWAVKNYGTLPASDVKVEVAVDRNGRGDFTRDLACCRLEILPQADLGSFVTVRIDRPTRDALVRGEPVVSGHITITYRSSAGAGFCHNADFIYDPAVQNFKPKSSETMRRDG